MGTGRRFADRQGKTGKVNPAHVFEQFLTHIVLTAGGGGRVRNGEDEISASVGKLGQHGQGRVVRRIPTEIGNVNAAGFHLCKKTICKGIFAGGTYIGAGIPKPDTSVHGDSRIARGDRPIKQPGLRKRLIQLHPGEFQNRYAQGHNVKMFHRFALTVIHVQSESPFPRRQPPVRRSGHNPPASPDRAIHSADRHPEVQAWSDGHANGAVPAHRQRRFRFR